ncbi:MAG: transglutaminase-like domain-containing protein [Planctomycetota bacterium]
MKPPRDERLAQEFGPPLLLVAVGGGAAAALLAEASAWPAGTQATLLVLAALFALAGAALGGFEIAALRTQQLTRERRAPLEALAGRPAAEPAGLPGARRAAVLAVTLLVLATMISVGLDALARAGGLRAGGASPPPPAAEERRTDPRADAPTAESDGSGGAGKLLDPDRSSDASLARRVRLISTAPVLEVRSTDGRLEPGRDALFLRGFTLNAYDESGRPASARGVRRVVRSGGGRLSNPLDEARGDTPTAGLEILPLGEHDGIVFAPAPLATLDVPSASIESARGVVLTRSPAPWTLRVERPIVDRRDLERARSSPSAAEKRTALPRAPEGSAASLALRRLSGRAQELTRRASSDLDRVVRVVQHFRSAYAYDLFDTRFQDPEGCLELLERRTGSCTHFASAASLMLRALGLRVRVVAGYVAHEATDDGAWLVRMRDGHAWIEVWFDGYGWLPFDPTPPAEGGARAPWAPVELARAPVAPLAALFGRAWSALAPVRSAVVAWALAAAVLGLLLRRIQRRASNRPGPEAATGPRRAVPPADASLARRFAAALGATGVARGEAETPLAFARRAERFLDAPDGLVVDAVEALLAAATGARPLADEETSRIEAAGRWLDARRRPRRGESPA